MFSDIKWRAALEREIVSVYIQSGKISSAFIGGSLAMGRDDPYSDIDLFLIWARPPTNAERHEAVRRSGGRVEVDWSDPPGRSVFRQLITEN